MNHARFDTAYLSPPTNPRLITGRTAGTRAGVARVRQAEEIQAIMTRIDRRFPVGSELRRWVEVRRYGRDCFYRGVATVVVADEGRRYYVDETGFPGARASADLPNRAELVKRRAAKETARRDRAAAAKQRREQLQASAGRSTFGSPAMSPHSRPPRRRPSTDRTSVQPSSTSVANGYRSRSRPGGLICSDQACPVDFDHDERFRVASSRMSPNETTGTRRPSCSTWTSRCRNSRSICCAWHTGLDRREVDPEG